MVLNSHLSMLIIIATVYGMPSGYGALLSVMVNVMCQLDWVMECPNIWSNIILSVSVGVISDEINF